MSNPSRMETDAFVKYLTKHNITDYQIVRGEVRFPCPFGDCDDDHRNREEYHCSFNTEKCLYQCFKCGAKGNFVTLQQHFGDYKKPSRKREKLDDLAEKWHKAMTEDLRLYLNGRGINDKNIEKYKLGYGECMGRHWLTIPHYNKDGKVVYFKLRRLSEDESTPKYKVYPSGASIIPYGVKELVESRSDDVLVCEGELDRIIALQSGVKMPVITGGGAAIFKDEWLPFLEGMRNIYVCMDTDEAGEKASNKMVELFSERFQNTSIHKVTLPLNFEDYKDLTDYFVNRYGTADELFTKYSKWVGGIKPIDSSQFKEMTVEDVAEVLSLTIKHDNTNKVITLLAMLLAYTESDQLNVVFNAASSTGKSYICKEVSKLFPPNDIKSYGRTSPTAFYHNESLMRKDEETGTSYIDLERKILIFTEQPDPKLMENLRAFLSHDDKKTQFSITNKGKGGANVAKDAYLLGFASVLFCSANMRMDEQEQTRCLILSPESDEKKVRSGILASVIKNSNKAKHEARLSGNEDRRLLMDRILYIKSLEIDDIFIRDDDTEYLLDCFYATQKFVTPRAQRDIAHLTSLVKGVALLNAPFRMVDGKVWVERRDIDEAMKLWRELSESMAYGVPPQVLNIYKQYILPAWVELNKDLGPDRGLWGPMSLDDFKKFYFGKTGTMPNLDMYRKVYIPMLETAGLITYERSESDKRKMVIVPQKFFE